jgi:hypothetical protein
MPKYEYLTVNVLDVTGQIKGPGSIQGLPYTSGKRLFVHDTVGIDNAMNGGSSDQPLATLDYAISLINASQGDQIICMEGHSQVLSAQVACDVIGTTVVGLGHGNARPTFTVDFASSPGGINVTAADFLMVNCIIKNGSTGTYTGTGATGASTRLTRIAADNAKFLNCEIVMPYRILHQNVIISGDGAMYENCVFRNTVALDDTTGAKAQTCILNIAGTDARVKGCRFYDLAALKAERWEAGVEGGKLTADLTVEDCLFETGGIATRTRTAGASGYMATIFCRAISPSSNTAAAGSFINTYQYLMESYTVHAINKLALVQPTSSDKRLKTDITYLEDLRMAA